MFIKIVTRIWYYFSVVSHQLYRFKDFFRWRYSFDYASRVFFRGVDITCKTYWWAEVTRVYLGILVNDYWRSSDGFDIVSSEGFTMLGSDQN